MTNHLICFFSKCKSKQQCSITSLWSEGPSSNSLNLINAGEDVEKGNPPTLLVGNVNWCIHYREQYGGSLKILKQNHHMTQQPYSGAYIQKNPLIRKDICIPMFKAALVKITKTWKQHKGPVIHHTHQSSH